MLYLGKDSIWTTFANFTNIALLKLFDIVQARIYSSFCTPECQIVLKFIFPREYI